jgi:hypothetical protein
MKKILVFLALIVVTVVTSTTFIGCAGACQRIKANGSIVGSTNGDWVVIKQSGGDITDVFLLEDVMVQSEPSSDGWLFLDQKGNPTHIGGDMKAIRITSDKQEMFSKYVEYHMEFTPLSYHEYFQKVKGNSQ